MHRLQAVETTVDDDNFVAGFVMPTLIDTWVAYLARIRPRANPDERMPEQQRRNLGYRMQLLEFECALLLLDRDARQNPSTSTLHETIARMKVHQVAVLAHTVLEGIGGHLVRVKAASRGEDVDPAAKISVDKWRPVLIEEALAQDASELLTEAELRERLGRLTAWRDRVHMDRVEPSDPLHFHEFTFEECFIPTHHTFRVVLTALSLDWPPGTCLNEEIA